MDTSKSINKYARCDMEIEPTGMQLKRIRQSSNLLESFLMLAIPNILAKVNYCCPIKIGND